MPRALKDPVNIMMHALDLGRSSSCAAAAILGGGRGGGMGVRVAGGGEPPPKCPSHRHNEGAAGYGIDQK